MDRRTFLAAAALAALAPPAFAVDDERFQLLAALQQRFLSFDARVVAQRAMTALAVPRRIAARIDALLATRATDQGFTSVRALMEDDAFGAEIRAEGAWFRDTLPGKLWLARHAKRAPASPEARAALAEQVFGWFDLDLAPYRAFVAGLPEGLAIVYGPVRDYPELAGLLLREPYALLCQLALGARAREVHLDPDDPHATVLDTLLDPTIRQVLFTGHGDWQSFVVGGLTYEPESIAARLCDRARTDPRGFLKDAARGLYVLAPTAKNGLYQRWYASLDERDLRALVEQLAPTDAQRDALVKDRIVRHTCGHGRYAAAAPLLWKRAPEALRAEVAYDGRGFSAKVPRDQDRWEAELAAWLADKALTVHEAPAFGESFVAGPQDTVGYEGDSWIDDFAREPLPPYRPPVLAWARPAP